MSRISHWKLIPALVASGLVVFLAACASQASQPPASTPSPAAPAPPPPVQAPPKLPAIIPSEPSKPPPPPPPPAVAPTGKVHKVSIKASSYGPSSLTVKIGDTVSWVNDDAVTHTVGGAGFGSGSLAPGATFSWVFSQAGTFEYRCSIHPVMTGKIVVEN